MKKIFITLLLLISFNSLSSQDNYKSLLIDYMTAQGQFETFNATIDQMGSMMGVTIKESDKEEFTKDVMGSLIDLLVPVYKKHFSEQDLKVYLSKISDEALYAYNVYQIEGEGRNLFLNITGDEDTIMGLPIFKIKEYLEKY